MLSSTDFYLQSFLISRMAFLQYSGMSAMIDEMICYKSMLVGCSAFSNRFSPSRLTTLTILSPWNFSYLTVWGRNLLQMRYSTTEPWLWPCAAVLMWLLSELTLETMTESSSLSVSW